MKISERTPTQVDRASKNDGKAKKQTEFENMFKFTDKERKKEEAEKLNLGGF